MAAAAKQSTKTQPGPVKPPLPPMQKGMLRKLRAQKAAASAAASPAASTAAASTTAAQEATNCPVRPRRNPNSAPMPAAVSLLHNDMAAAVPDFVEPQIVARTSSSIGSTAFGSPVRIGSSSPNDPSTTTPYLVKALGNSRLSVSPVLSPMDWQPTTPVQNVADSVVSAFAAVPSSAVLSPCAKSLQARPSALGHLFRNADRSAFAQQELQQHQLVSRINGQTTASSPFLAFGIGSSSFGVSKQSQSTAAARNGNRKGLLLNIETTSGKENMPVTAQSTGSRVHHVAIAGNKRQPWSVSDCTHASRATSQITLDAFPNKSLAVSPFKAYKLPSTYSDPHPCHEGITKKTPKSAAAKDAVYTSTSSGTTLSQASADVAFTQTSVAVNASPSMGGDFQIPPVSTPVDKGFRLFGKVVSPADAPCAPGQSKTKLKFKKLIMKGKELFVDGAAGYAYSLV